MTMTLVLSKYMHRAGLALRIFQKCFSKLVLRLFDSDGNEKFLVRKIVLRKLLG